MYDNLCWIILKVLNLISLKCLLNIEKLLHWDFTEQCVIKELWRHSFTWLIEFDSEWNSNDVEMAFSLNLHISLRNDVEVVWLWFLFKNDCYIYHAIQIMYTTQRNATNCTSNIFWVVWTSIASQHVLCWTLRGNCEYYKYIIKLRRMLFLPQWTRHSLFAVFGVFCWFNMNGK